ncbi:MAG TPA: hypothetical protein VII94_04115 [Candidatus Saccharimonadales bacterium]
MKKLLQIIVAYAKPVNPNGYEKIDWQIENFNVCEEQANSFQELQKKKGLLTCKLYCYDSEYQIVWEDQFGHGVVVAGKQSNKLSGA